MSPKSLQPPQTMQGTVEKDGSAFFSLQLTEIWSVAFSKKSTVFSKKSTSNFKKSTLFWGFAIKKEGVPILTHPPDDMAIALE